MGRSFRDLVVWQKSKRRARDIDSASAGFSRDEVFDLAGPMRRPAVSVPSNLAEGAGRGSRADFRRFIKTPAATDLRRPLKSDDH